MLNLFWHKRFISKVLHMQYEYLISNLYAKNYSNERKEFKMS